MTFSIVVAIDEKRGIGKSGGLPWRLSRDMQRFKDITLPCTKPGSRNVVVMGRKTWESLPAKFRPLPGRLNIVISSRSNMILPDGVLCASSLRLALEIVQKIQDVADVFVIGGGMLFAEAIKLDACQGLYVTHIDGDFLCDVFFPQISENFKIVNKSDLLEEQGLRFYFCDYKKRGPISDR
ncbi:MAG: dihydrofolate reductase [Candidatus Omnitrophica bacterium]|nr:dihydrofolate reductase [Candidatus Omnitrophota bacterium]